MTIGVGGGTTIGSGITLDGGNVSLPTISAYTPAFTSFVPTPLTYTTPQTGYTVANGASNYQVVLTGQGLGPAYDSATVTTTPANGTVSITGTNIYYTSTGAAGADSFVLSLSAAGATQTVAVNLTVLSAVPNYTTIQNFNVSASTTNYPVILTGNSAGAAYTSVSLYSAPVLAGGGAGGTVTILGTNIYYTPPSTYAGYDTFFLNLTNSGGTEQVRVNMFVVGALSVYGPGFTVYLDQGTPVVNNPSNPLQLVSLGSGGLPPYAYNIVSGILPAGLQLFSSNGIVYGTPTVITTSNIGARITDSLGSTSQTVYTNFNVVSLITATANTAAPVLYVGDTVTSYQPLTAANGRPMAGAAGTYTFSNIGALPDGLTLNPYYGTVSGTVAGSAGTYNTTFSVQDWAFTPATATTTANVAFTVRNQLIATPGPAATQSLEVGVPFSYSTFTSVSGGTPPYTYSTINNTSLAGVTSTAGPTLNSATGVLTGNPTLAGSNGNQTFVVTDSLGHQAATKSIFNYTVADLLIFGANMSPQVCYTGIPVTFQPITAISGGTPPYTCLITPVLPTGLTLYANGVVAGTPTVASAATNYTLSVRDANNITTNVYSGSTYLANVSIAVAAASITASATTTAQSYVVSRAITAFQPLTAAGGTAPYNYTVTPALPAGLSLNSTTGQVSGTPTVAASAANYVFSVRDANNIVAATTATVSFTVATNPITIKYLVVGGGGGGWQGSGGGAGGVVCGTLSLSLGTTYTVSIGSGGSGDPANITVGTANNGTPSTFSGGGLLVTAVGGGGSWKGGGPVGNGGSPGGSGGGSIQPAPVGPAGTATQPAQTQSVGTSGTYTNRGYPGGVWYGGGGGAGAAGASRTPTVFVAPGGAGYTWPYTATAYAGGGGGSNTAAAAGGAGGVGGGGAGGPGAVPGSGKNATYYGGGGGGWGAGTIPGTVGPYAGGTGYPGAVILAIPTPQYPGSAPGATVTTPPAAPGMTVITYASPGTYTA
jgi:hypothetical protein